jgi:Zn-dependent protease with chaperone function
VSPPTAVLSPVIRREEQRRRVVLLGLGALLVLSLFPVFGHHLIGAVPWLHAGQEHLGVLCLVALHGLLAPVHGGFHLLLYAGLAFATVERGRAWRRHRQLMRRVTGRSPADLGPFGPFVSAARGAGIPSNRLLVVPGLPVPAFTTGFLRPRVVVAEDLATRLAPAELVAVLAHEAVHLRRRDPLRLFLLRALAGVLFWIPALARFAADLEDEMEIRADDEVARTHALPLASALLQLVGAGEAPGDTVGFQRADLLPRRIRRLAGEDEPVTSHVSRRSLGVAGGALVAVWLSGVMVLHPLAPSGDPLAPPAHCDHPGDALLSHLFCRGWWWQAGPLPAACPHATTDETEGVAIGASVAVFYAL